MGHFETGYTYLVEGREGPEEGEERGWRVLFWDVRISFLWVLVC